jgi:hypothetical protein
MKYNYEEIQKKLNIAIFNGFFTTEIERGSYYIYYYTDYYDFESKSYEYGAITCFTNLNRGRSRIDFNPREA